MAKKQRPTWRRYTVIALIVSGLALLGTLFFLITKGLLNIGMYSGATIETLNRGLIISLGILILSLALYAILEPEKIRRVATGRQARYGSNTLVTSVAFIGILIALNLLARSLTVQYPDLFDLDLTEDKVNTLASETIQALENLPGPVNATAFYSSNLPTNSAVELLDKFKTNSKGRFDYQFVNPDTDPVAAREAGVTGDGKIMLVMGERREIANFASETELTKSLIKLINPEARAVYFLAGHGEMSLEFSDYSFATAKSTLESKNYTVKSLNLLTDNMIPEDALVIIIAGPTKQVSDHEVELLKQYVDGGGALIAMENPLLLTDFGNAPDPLAEYFTTDWGINLNDEIIIDKTSPFGVLFAVSAIASQHPITQDINQNLIIIMPQARSISLNTPADGITQTSLLLTSQNSWGDVNFTNAESAQLSFDPEDVPGPLVMAASGENSSNGGRVVVFGNSLFASNDNFDAYGNGNFFINSVDWAAEQENLINITPNTPKARTITLSSQTQWLVILLGSVLIIPGMVVFAGISSWMARRRQG